MKKSKTSTIPKFKVGDTLVPGKEGKSYPPILISRIEPSDWYYTKYGAFTYYYITDNGYEACWTEDYLRPLTKLDKALQ